MALSFTERFTRIPRSTMFAVGLLMIAVINYLDYRTDADLGFFIASLAPVIFFTLVGGFPVGAILSVVSVGTWLIIDIVEHGGYFSFWLPAWNYFVRLAIFLLCTHVLWRLNYLQKRQIDLIDFVVHDLRTPLLNVSLELDRLQSGELGTVDARQQKTVRNVQVSCNRLSTLINSLLDLSRLEGGGLRPTLGDVSIAEIFGQAMQSVATWAETRGIALTTAVAADAGRCCADAVLLQRILINLLGNAIRVSTRGSTITMATAVKGKDLVISVRDQGKGIPRHLIGKVFDKFEQESRGVGSGIGLTFCKMATEAQRGRIWLESEEGKGTCVFLSLPRAATGGMEKKPVR